MSEIIKTSKTVSETMADIRRLMKNWDVEDFEVYPQETGLGYTVRFMRGQAWTDISSSLQPSKAKNLRVCYQVIQTLKTWGERGIVGLAKGTAFVGTLVPTKGENRESFEDACAILGIEPSASLDEARKVYQVKVQFAHPDKGGDPERFKRIQTAWEYIEKVKRNTP